MPITQELENIKKLEAVGFDHKQAEALAGIIEKAHVDGREDLKGFIRQELDNVRQELRQEINQVRNEIKQEIKDLEVRLAWALKDHLIKLFGIIFGTVGLAVAILKAFP